MLTERGIKSSINRPNAHWKRSGKEELFWQTMEQIISQWFCFSVETSERHQQLQGTIPQNTGESTTRRRSELVILQVWKNTIHTTLSPPSALQIREDDVRQVFKNNKKRKAPGPDGVSPACLKTCADQLAPIFTIMNSTVLHSMQWSHSDSWAPQFLRTWSGTLTLSPLLKRPSRDCTSFTSWGSLTCHRSCWYSSTLHHWIRPLYVNNCLVQRSYQIWPQKTMEGSPDCWANHWYNPPQSPRTVLIQSEKKGWQNHSGPLTSSTLPLWTVTIWSTLQSSEHQNNETLELPTLVSSPKQSISWTLDIKHGTPNTIIHYLFITHTYF